MISVISLDQITLQYVLDHCDKDNWEDAAIAKSRYSEKLGAGINKEIRNLKTSTIDSELHSILDKHVGDEVQKYANDHGFNVSRNTSYSLARYSVGDFFVEHTDTTVEFPRTISAVLYLNEDYDGGTITFTKLNKTFKPKANSLFIFPSTEDFSHSADPVLSGTKYVIIGFWS